VVIQLKSKEQMRISCCHRHFRPASPFQAPWAFQFSEPPSFFDDIPARVKICDQIGASGHIPLKHLQIERFPAKHIGIHQ
jgi:hypothetical protein